MADRPIRIMDATEAHLPALVAIYNQAVRDTFSIWSEEETTLDQRRRWMDIRRSAGLPVLIAAVAPEQPSGESEIVGYASYGPFRDFPGYRFTVEHSVYVAPALHRSGVGRMLLGALIERARAAGLRRMVGGVDAANSASIALHTSLGFELQGTLEGVGEKFGKSLDLAFLVKRL
ncbi:GNAT family N-acetyltransferase [bacterium]|nr:GNAT family N-acetyltransferase [bacterium]